MTRKVLDAVTFNSLEELADAAYKHSSEPYVRSRRVAGTSGYAYAGDAWNPTWCEADSPEHARRLAIHGWQDQEVDALRIAESAVETVQAEHEVEGFRAYHDVSGCEVDVARYLEGEPECMVEYETIMVPRVGRVITLCSSVSMSASISGDTIIKRGNGVCALAFALTSLGFAVELWADWTSRGTGTHDVGHIRTLVKGCNDELDPAKIMFAYAHPCMLRGLTHPAAHELNQDCRAAIGIGDYYGIPAAPVQDLPEGTIYLPQITSARDVPNADALLLQYLRELGLVSD